MQALTFAMHSLNGAFIEPRYLGFAYMTAMAVAYVPVYLFTVLVWALWLVVIWGRADRRGRA